MLITREQIAAAIRGVGLTNGRLSDITRDRAARGLGKPVSAEAISGYLKAGYGGSDLKVSLVTSMVEALIDEGAEFAADNWVRLPEGALARRRKKTGKGQ